MRLWEHEPWGEPYRAAVLELDRTKLTGRIEVARKAIDLRIAELSCASNDRPKDIGELGALQDALYVLQLIEKHEPLRKKAD